MAETKTGGQKAAQEQAQDTKKVTESDPTNAGANEGTAGQTAGVGEDTVLVTASDRIEGVYDETSSESLVTLTKDVVEEFYYPGTKRPATRILFTKGQVVPKAVIDSLNARVDATEAKTSAERLAEYVDSTTLASGTGAGVEQAEGSKK